MRSPADEDKLGYGRIVWVDVYGSAGGDAGSEPHPAIILDDDDTVAAVRDGRLKPPELWVVVISTKDYHHPLATQMPVVPRWFLRGSIQGKWVVQVPLLAIKSVHWATANATEMEQIQSLIRASRIL
jgi:hypothetical protein